MRKLSDIEAGSEAATRGWEFIGEDHEHYGFGQIAATMVDGVHATRVLCRFNEAWDTAETDARFAAAARSDVPDLCAQIRADDVIFLWLEWLGREPDGIGTCPECCNTIGEEHCADCDLGRRCDEARARQEGER